jgi:hypothetical protein
MTFLFFEQISYRRRDIVILIQTSSYDISTAGGYMNADEVETALLNLSEAHPDMLYALKLAVRYPLLSINN